MDNIQKYNILKYKKNEIFEEEDIVIVEYPFSIFLNDKEFVTMFCTPQSLDKLAVGFLYSEGIINSKDEIRSIQIDEEKGRAYVNTVNNDIFDFLGDKLSGKRIITTACGKQRTIAYNVIDFLGTESDKIKNSISIEPE